MDDLHESGEYTDGSQHERVVTWRLNLPRTFGNVAWDGEALSLAKVLTTPTNPVEGFVAGVQALGVEWPQITDVVHGTTVATNAVIERKGAKTALVTTRGFRDLLEIQRQDKSDIYDLRYRKPEAPVPPHLCFEVSERISATGEVVEPLDEAELSDILLAIEREEVESVAVCFLNSYRDPAHERRARELIREHRPDLAVSLSSDVLPEFREYERAVATCFDATLSGPIGDYVDGLATELEGRGFTGTCT